VPSPGAPILVHNRNCCPRNQKERRKTEDGEERGRIGLTCSSRSPRRIPGNHNSFTILCCPPIDNSISNERKSNRQSNQGFRSVNAGAKSREARTFPVRSIVRNAEPAPNSQPGCARGASLRTGKSAPPSAVTDRLPKTNNEKDLLCFPYFCAAFTPRRPPTPQSQLRQPIYPHPPAITH